MKIIIILLILIAILMYLIILGANKCKTDEERAIEDREQIEYLRKYKR